ncbi:MAG: hypothetical protein AAFO82_08610, partial [Bacteroidota bacterium]
MPNIIVVRLRPNVPQVATDFTSDYLTGLSIELRALVAEYTDTAFDTASQSDRIIQHRLLTEDQSVATAVLQVPDEAIQNGKANFRLTMLRTGTPVLDIASYNVDILAVGILPTENTATYQALAVSSYLVIPQGDPSPALIPEDMIGLPSGGVAPSYEQLNTAVTTAADSLGLEIDTLSLTDAQN